MSCGHDTIFNTLFYITLLTSSSRFSAHRYQETLPKLIHSRKEAHVTHEELVQITKWKLFRGKNRSRILDLVRINTELAVASTTKKAFKKASKDICGAINALTSLKGIGPATASAILAAGYPEYCPYMADESMLSTPGVEATDYTLAEFSNYSDQIKKLTARLNEMDVEAKWTPHKVELALWTHYVAKELEPSILESLPPPSDSGAPGAPASDTITVPTLNDQAASDVVTDLVSKTSCDTSTTPKESEESRSGAEDGSEVEESSEEEQQSPQDLTTTTTNGSSRHGHDHKDVISSFSSFHPESIIEKRSSEAVDCSADEHPNGENGLNLKRIKTNDESPLRSEVS